MSPINRFVELPIKMNLRFQYEKVSKIHTVNFPKQPTLGQITQLTLQTPQIIVAKSKKKTIHTPDNELAKCLEHDSRP
jgi:hypothetical protein